MRRLIPAATALILGISSLGFAKSTPPRSSTELMKWKLQRAQNVLAGIATKDFRKIQTNAEELGMISQVATWKAIDDADFRHESEAFRRTVKNLEEQAKAKSMEGVSMGYVRLVLHCVQCHEIQRDGTRKK